MPPWKLELLKDYRSDLFINEESFQEMEKEQSLNYIKIFKNYVGRYATSMEMAGMSVTVLKLNNIIKEYLLAPTNCPFWTN